MNPIIFLLSYPEFPANNNIANEIIALILWIIEIPMVALANVIITVFQYIGQSMGSSAGEILAFPGQIFQQTVNSFHQYGIFAPIIASIIWGIAIIILIFFGFKALQIAGDEATNEE